jgi:hypothetical protein
MPTGLKIIPVDYRSPEDREADLRSLILRLERQGRCKTASPMRMLRARALYCNKFLDRAAVARAVGVTVGDVDHWVLVDGWEKQRHENEFKQYQKVAGVRRRVMPDIDEKHDRMFHNLEALLEDTVFRIKRDEIEMDPKDLVSLANAAKTCMEARRTIHKKEGPARRHVFELEDPTLLNEFAAMVMDLTSSGKARVEVEASEPEVIKQIPYSIEDQHLEDQKDAI